MASSASPELHSGGVSGHVQIVMVVDTNWEHPCWSLPPQQVATAKGTGSPVSVPIYPF